MSTGLRLLAIALCAGWIGSAGHPGVAAAQTERVWPVKNKLEGPDDKKSRDVSGIACTTERGFPRACLVIDDNLQSAQLVTLQDGEIVAGQSIRLIDNTFHDKSLELDGEGVAYSNGFFYVIGSHGHPRDKKGKLDPVGDADKIKARIAAASQLIRIRVDPGTGAPVPAAGAASERPEVISTAKLKTLIAAQPKLAPFVDKRLEANGVTIEGIAILGSRLFAGFRGPVVNGDRAAVLSVALPSLFGDKAPDAKLRLLPLGKGRGVRDLAPFGSGLLVLAGPVSDAGGGRYAVFWWDGVGEKPKLLKDLARYTEDGNELKPEALLPLGETSSGLRVLVLFDGAKEGGARAIEVKKP